jgi:hypothetical protein
MPNIRQFPSHFRQPPYWQVQPPQFYQPPPTPPHNVQPVMFQAPLSPIPSRPSRYAYSSPVADVKSSPTVTDDEQNLSIYDEEANLGAIEMAIGQDHILFEEFWRSKQYPNLKGAELFEQYDKWKVSQTKSASGAVNHVAVRPPYNSAVDEVPPPSPDPQPSARTCSTAVETGAALAHGHGVHGIASGSRRQLSRDDVAPFDDISNVEWKSMVVKGRRKPL